jgi:hypothetical protein
VGAIFSGHCLCGAVIYECSASPIVMGNCHCRDCQRVTGCAYAAGILVPISAVTVTGDVRYYETTADSGDVISRGICPVCGSRLIGKGAPAPDSMSIMAGTLDDPTFFRPQADIYVSSAQPWDHMNPRLPKFRKMPPMS